MSGVKRPGEGEGPDGKRAYAGPSADFMDAEPELPEEYEDPDDDDVFLNDVMDQKVSARIVRSSVPSFFSNRGVAGFHPSRANTLHPTVSLTASSPRVPPLRRSQVNIANDAEREHWKRKPAPTLDASKDNLCFQQLDIDYVIGEPHAMLGPDRKAQGDSAQLRIFGVTAGGNSVCVHVHGFEPYFYAKVPDAFKDEMCEPFRVSLNGAMAANQRGGNQRGNGTFIGSVEIVRDKQSLMYFQEGKTSTFVKVTTTLPNMVATARGIIEKQGVTVPGLHHTSLTFQTFESNVLYTLRFMVDAAWWAVTGSSCPRADTRSASRRSRACASTSATSNSTRSSRTPPRVSTPSWRRSASSLWTSSAPVARVTSPTRITTR